MSIRAMSYFAGGAVILMLVAALWVQGQILSTTKDTLSDVTKELITTRRANIELVRDAHEASVRQTVVSEGREAIIVAPEGDNGGVANVLLQGLQTADRIGGIQ